MGCDIHIVLEQLDPDFGWVGIDTFRGHHSAYAKSGDDYHSPAATSRHYERFAALAGVRGDGPAPRGIPSDASLTTHLLVKEWDADGHSHSWLPAKEAAALFNVARYPAEKPPEPGSYRDLYPTSFWFGIEGDNIDCYRIVFWFDN